MSPLPVNQVLVLMPALSERQENLEVPISVTERLPVHGLPLLPEAPVPHDADLLGELVQLGDPVEVDCLGRAPSRVAVAALKALVL